MNLKDKLFKNALVMERLGKVSKEDRQVIVLHLLKNKSERELAKELGVHHSTLHDWKSLRQNNVGENAHLSLSFIVRKLEHLKAAEIIDWGRIEQINDLTNDLLRKRNI